VERTSPAKLRSALVRRLRAAAREEGPC